MKIVLKDLLKQENMSAFEKIGAYKGKAKIMLLLIESLEAFSKYHKNFTDVRKTCGEALCKKAEDGSPIYRNVKIGQQEIQDFDFEPENFLRFEESLTEALDIEVEMPTIDLEHIEDIGLTVAELKSMLPLIKQ